MDLGAGWKLCSSGLQSSKLGNTMHISVPTVGSPGPPVCLHAARLTPSLSPVPAAPVKGRTSATPRRPHVSVPSVPAGRQEDDSTRLEPRVTAEWHAVGGPAGADRFSVVHAAQSDEIALHSGGAKGEPRQGMAAVWLIYADFMGAEVPDGWPREPEFAGGILAYFEIEWNLDADRAGRFHLRQLAPKRSTGFNWERWSLGVRGIGLSSTGANEPVVSSSPPEPAETVGPRTSRGELTKPTRADLMNAL